MTPTRQGSFRLFKFAGVAVYLHWSWFIIGVLLLPSRARNYDSYIWGGLEYVSLFVIVLLHEFGHSLACRQVGGRADEIVLWPLGGVAYVAPPPRPGATLWSIAAGPLVNVILVPILAAVSLLARTSGLTDTSGDLTKFLFIIQVINGLLLGFNLLPIYPLDGGQIVRSLLWFVLGRARSLMVAAVFGLIALIGLFAFALGTDQRWGRDPWLIVLGIFIALNCWRGLKEARALARLAKAPRHHGVACPACQAAPPAGNLWRCGNCRNALDMFASRGFCPHCGAQFAATHCIECGTASTLDQWYADGRSAPPPL